MEPITIKYKHHKIKYDITLTSKYTFIQGASGTGKSSLFNLVKEYQICADGLALIPLHSHTAPDTDQIVDVLKFAAGRTKAIYVGDERIRYLNTETFQRAMILSEHLFVIMSRCTFDYIPQEEKTIMELVTQDGCIMGQLLSHKPTSLFR